MAPDEPLAPLGRSRESLLRPSDGLPARPSSRVRRLPDPQVSPTSRDRSAAPAGPRTGVRPAVRATPVAVPSVGRGGQRRRHRPRRGSRGWPSRCWLSAAGALSPPGNPASTAGLTGRSERGPLRRGCRPPGCWPGVLLLGSPSSCDALDGVPLCATVLAGSAKPGGKSGGLPAAWDSPPAASVKPASRCALRRRRRRRGLPSSGGAAGRSPFCEISPVITVSVAWFLSASVASTGPAARGGRRRRRRWRRGDMGTSLSPVALCGALLTATSSADLLGGLGLVAPSAASSSARTSGGPPFIRSLGGSSEECGIIAFPRLELCGPRRLWARGPKPRNDQGMRSSRSSARGSSAKWSRSASAARDSGSTRA
jgi:hypothetical protein